MILYRRLDVKRDLESTLRLTLLVADNNGGTCPACALLHVILAIFAFHFVLK